MSDISQLSSKLQSVSLASVSASHNLSTLPVDILTHDLVPQFASPPIQLSQYPTTQSSPDSRPLRQLAATSRHFRATVKSQYKAYVQHQYPTVYSHVIARHSASLDQVDWSSLATQSEKLCHRWNLRQFSLSKLQTVEPSPARQHDSHPRSTVKPSHSYSPCIDVSESINGTETLVIGQGPSVALRTGEYGAWQEIKRKGMTPGADDILSVHIYNPDTVISTRSSSVEIISNVSGADDGNPPRIVSVTELFPSGPKNPTGGISSSCFDTSSSSSSTRSFAITTSITSSDSHSLQLFTLNTTSSTPSFPKTPTITSPLPSKPYTSTFITNTTIATGHRSGLTVHNLAPSEVSSTTIPQPLTSYSHALSVHSLTRLSSSPAFSPSIFASGWSDGITRLFDIRANAYVAEYENPVSNEAVPVYSLLHTAPLGNILLSGSSLHHAVEVHDLRYCGNMVGYFSPYAFDPASLNDGEKMRDIVSEGGLLFFDNVAGTRLPTARRNGYTRNSGKGTSSIYSLCSPSPSSGKVYIGAENTVLQMDFRKRKVGREWGLGLSNVEKVRKKEMERGATFNVPMYWFDPAKGVGDEEGGVNGRWWCGSGKAAFKVKERGAVRGGDGWR
ncbi:hypothetical protein TWF192_009860 [Orbilia oligospora]|uniref:F-box domain-containing protein n=1 Tax=Orbilia oligospora TaxID=2813651 RepID=A0A6G1MIY3_ORBOL|nr:hypothetical protein TWF679_005396 [Orbilia oligospora]KAF3260579.1 hypothetical protein TWF192_009860 [Orbilia oligospora]